MGEFGKDWMKMCEVQVYKSVKETANRFICGDCKEVVHHNPYCESHYIGSGWSLQTLLHRCDQCITKIAVKDNAVFQKLIDDSKKQREKQK